MDREVTASRCATMACVSLPVELSKKRMCLSSCAVMVKGRVGCEITLVMGPISGEEEELCRKNRIMMALLKVRKILSATLVKNVL